GQHETRHPAHVVDTHGDGALALVQQRRKRGALAGSCDFCLEDEFVALQRRECDPAAVLEQLVPCRVGTLGHLARRPGNLGDVLTIERRTKAEWHCRHHDRAAMYRCRHGVRGYPFSRQVGGHTAHRDGDEKKEEVTSAHPRYSLVEGPRSPKPTAGGAHRAGPGSRNAALLIGRTSGNLSYSKIQFL